MRDKQNMLNARRTHDREIVIARRIAPKQSRDVGDCFASLEMAFEQLHRIHFACRGMAHAPNGTKISHQKRIFTRINMDELGFEVRRKVKIWLNLVAFPRAPLF